MTPTALASALDAAKGIVGSRPSIVTEDGDDWTADLLREPFIDREAGRRDHSLAYRDLAVRIARPAFAAALTGPVVPDCSITNLLVPRDEVDTLQVALRDHQPFVSNDLDSRMAFLRSTLWEGSFRVLAERLSSSPRSRSTQETNFAAAFGSVAVALCATGRPRPWVYETLRTAQRVFGNPLADRIELRCNDEAVFFVRRACCLAHCTGPEPVDRCTSCPTLADDERVRRVVNFLGRR